MASTGEPRLVVRGAVRITAALAAAVIAAAVVAIYHAPRLAASSASSLVLIAGGEGDDGNDLASAELFDPASDSFTRLAQPMPDALDRPGAVALADGTVLIAGGTAGGVPSSVAMRYDPQRFRFSALENMNDPRVGHTMTLLDDGSVLIAGGDGGSATAEIYDPVSQTFACVGGFDSIADRCEDSMAAARNWHVAARLDDGQVLLAGGNDARAVVASAEVYDPATGTFSPANGSMSAGREHATATLLDSTASSESDEGLVLIVGGRDASAHTLKSAELYDPATGMFSPVAPMAGERQSHTATMLADGRVLVAGGGVASAELFDPSAARWLAAGALGSARSGHSATLLENGQVLIAGGERNLGADGGDVILGSAELFDPETMAFSCVARSKGEAGQCDSAMSTMRTYHIAIAVPRLAGQPDQAAGTSPATKKTKLHPLTVSRKTLKFSKVQTGTKMTKSVTLTNHNSVADSLSAPEVTGSFFSLLSNGCGSSVAAGGTCQIDVQFDPLTAGKKFSGTLTIADSAPKSPHLVKLSGSAFGSPVATSTAPATSTATATATVTPTPTATPTPVLSGLVADTDDTNGVGDHGLSIYQTANGVTFTNPPAGCTNPVFTFPGLGGPTTSTTPTAASITLPHSGDALLWLSGNDTTPTLTVPGEYSTAWNIQGVGYGNIASSAAYILGASSGATGNVSGTLTFSANWTAVQVALKPATTIRYVNSWSDYNGDSNNSSSSALNIPTSTGAQIQAGDVMVADLSFNLGDTITRPSGWNVAVSKFVNHAYAGWDQVVYYKVATSDDIGTTFTWAFSRGANSAGGITDFRGVDNSNPIDAAGTGSVGNHTSLGTQAFNIIQHGGIYYLVYEINDFNPPVGEFGIATAYLPCGPWTWQQDVVVNAKPTATQIVWDVQWFVDDDGSYYVIYGIGDWKAPNDLVPYLIKSTSPTFTTWGTPTQITGTGLPSNFQGTGIVSPHNSPNGLYNLFGKDETAMQIDQLSSSALTSGYTMTATEIGGTTNIENTGVPLLSQNGNGTWRFYIDQYSSSARLSFIDSENNWTSWSAIQNLTAPRTLTCCLPYLASPVPTPTPTATPTATYTTATATATATATPECTTASDCPSGEACDTNKGTCTTTCGIANVTPCNGGCCNAVTEVCVSGDANSACGNTGGTCANCTATCNPGPICLGGSACGCTISTQCATDAACGTSVVCTDNACAP